MMWPLPKSQAQNCRSRDPPLQNLLVTIHEPAARQIIRRELHRYLVARQNPDEIFPHLAGNMRQHLMLVLELHAKHRIWQRLNHRGHDFYGVLFGNARAAFFFFLANGSRHNLLRCQRRVKTQSLSCTCEQRARRAVPLQNLCHDVPDLYQDGPVISFGRVKIQGPFAVIATVCSKCAEGLPSAVSATHSSRIRTSGPPALTIGSTAMTIPSCNRAPRPSSP